jgi:predicted lactoylglutathione lyase
MTTKIFLNLPVADLNKSVTFFTSLGYTFNKQFTDETSTCMIISEHIYAMLLTHDKFKKFAPNAICDTSKSNEVLITLSCENRAQVDELVAKAVAAGGRTVEDAEDLGFMYSHGYMDLDGHAWGLFYMDPSFVQPQ